MYGMHDEDIRLCIYSITGYENALVQIPAHGRGSSYRAFVAVPMWAAQKLLSMNTWIANCGMKIRFTEAVFTKIGENDEKSLFIRAPHEESPNAWMRPLIRNAIHDVLGNLVDRGLIPPNSYSLSRSFRLELGDLDGKYVELIHSFINGVPFQRGKDRFFIRAYFVTAKSNIPTHL